MNNNSANRVANANANANGVANAGAGKNKTAKAKRRTPLEKAENNIKAIEALLEKKAEGKYKSKKNLNAALRNAITRRNALRVRKGTVNELIARHAELKATAKKLYAEHSAAPKGAEKEDKKAKYLKTKAMVEDLEKEIREAKGIKSATKSAKPKLIMPSINNIKTLTENEIVERLKSMVTSIKESAANIEAAKTAKDESKAIIQAAKANYETCKLLCKKNYKAEKERAEALVKGANAK